MDQQDLLSWTHGERDGSTYVAARDRLRLDNQHERVFELMKDGQWRRKEEIVKATGDDWASISARLRDCRKERFGGHTVDRRNIGGGVHEYRLMVNRQGVAA